MKEPLVYAVTYTIGELDNILLALMHLHRDLVEEAKSGSSILDTSAQAVRDLVLKTEEKIRKLKGIEKKNGSS